MKAAVPHRLDWLSLAFNLKDCGNEIISPLRYFSEYTDLLNNIHLIFWFNCAEHKKHLKRVKLQHVARAPCTLVRFSNWLESHYIVWAGEPDYLHPSHSIAGEFLLGQTTFSTNITNIRKQILYQIQWGKNSSTALLMLCRTIYIYISLSWKWSIEKSKYRWKIIQLGD